MAKVYADLIRKGLGTLEQVPEKLKAEVEAMLHAQAAAFFRAEKGGGRDGSDLRDLDYQGKEDLHPGP